MDDVDLAEFWKRHRSYVYLQCYKLLRDQAAAEDSTQETLLRVQRHFDKIPPRANEALAWIARVARNCCLNEIRNKGRRPEPRAELPDEAAIGDRIARDALDHSTETLANRQLIERLIDRMPDKLMNVAWLYHVHEMNQQEVADTLGISRRTVVERLGQFSESSRRLIQRLQWSRHVAADS